MRQTSWLFLFFIFSRISTAQPGPMPEPVSVTVYNGDKNISQQSWSGFQVEWAAPAWGDANAIPQNWQPAAVSKGVFVTGPVLPEHNPVWFKIYNSSGDTMWVSCFSSLHRVLFQPGVFQFDRHTAFLANMETLNGAVIRNQQWNYYRTLKHPEIPVLSSTRYFYDRYRAEMDPEEEYNEGIQHGGFRRSDHLETEDDNETETVMELGILYADPGISSSVYCIGYTTDYGDEKLGPNTGQYLLESTDRCRSWKIKFPLQESNATLVNITPDGFWILREYPDSYLLFYDRKGKVKDSAEITASVLEHPLNRLGTSPERQDLLLGRNSAVSDPVNTFNTIIHQYHREFTNDGKTMIRIDTLPYYPRTISRSEDGGQTWKTLIKLNSHETYVYLTMRKNKLVLLSYNYMLVSRDFGNTWTFYRNSSFMGGDWNFIWLDDDTLVNVVQDYADVFVIR